LFSFGLVGQQQPQLTGAQLMLRRYGDITPRSDSERLLAFFIMLIGGVGYAFLIGAMASVVRDIDSETRANSARVSVRCICPKSFNVPLARELHLLKCSITHNQPIATGNQHIHAPACLSEIAGAESETVLHATLSAATGGR
jgi:hypothetical protein